MDETGWREDGSNGYVWCACTPQLRYYEYQHSRGGEVVKAVLGERFEGVLGSDFLASYNIHEGFHQRCWVHLLRDRHELKEHYPDDADVQQWAKAVKAVYDRAVAYAGPDLSSPVAKQAAARRTQQHAFEQELWQLCAPMRTRLRPCIRCVSASSASYRNSLSLWPGLRFQPTTIWRNAVCARWSLRAKSVVARAAPTGPRPAWHSSVFLAPGRLRDSIRSSIAWLCLLSPTL